MSRTFKKNNFHPLKQISSNYYVLFSLTNEPNFIKINHPNEINWILKNTIPGPLNMVTLPKWDFVREQLVRIILKRNCINADMHIKIASGKVEYVVLPKTDSWTYVYTDQQFVAIEGKADQVFLFCYRQWTSNVERAREMIDRAICRQKLAKELKDKEKRFKLLSKNQ